MSNPACRTRNLSLSFDFASADIHRRNHSSILAWLSLQIHQTVTSGGKVLVPVFAVGRAQELLMLLDEHWTRTQQQVGIRFHKPDPEPGAEGLGLRV